MIWVKKAKAPIPREKKTAKVKATICLVTTLVAIASVTAFIYYRRSWEIFDALLLAMCLVAFLVFFVFSLYAIWVELWEYGI